MSQKSTDILGQIKGKMPKYEEFQKIIKKQKRDKMPRIEKAYDTMKGIGTELSKKAPRLTAAGKGMGGVLKKVYSKSPLGVGVMGGVVLGSLLTKKKDKK